MMNEKMTKILADEELVKKLDNAQDEVEFCNILAENGATADEINAFIEHLRSLPDPNAAGELSEDDLDNVAGGGKPWLQICFHKWGYRFKYGNFFVKATYDENRRTITVTNRFGKLVSETNPY